MLACCVIALESVVNAGGNQLGTRSVSFDEIAYVPEARYGPAAVAVNAGLTALRTLGWCFVLNGLLQYRRSQKDGHTGLSGETTSHLQNRRPSWPDAIFGPQVINALQNTLQLHW
ncbi:conjugal transfer protein TraQ [Escherichia coli]